MRLKPLLQAQPQLVLLILLSAPWPLLPWPPIEMSIPRWDRILHCRLARTSRRVAVLLLILRTMRRLKLNLIRSLDNGWHAGAHLDARDRRRTYLGPLLAEWRRLWPVWKRRSGNDRPPPPHASRAVLLLDRLRRLWTLLGPLRAGECWILNRRCRGPVPYEVRCGAKLSWSQARSLRARKRRHLVRSAHLAEMHLFLRFLRHLPPGVLGTRAMFRLVGRRHRLRRQRRVPQPRPA